MEIYRRDDASAVLIAWEDTKSNIDLPKSTMTSDNAWQEWEMERYPRDDLNVRHTAPEAVALSGLSYGGTMHSGCHVLY